MILPAINSKRREPKMPASAMRSYSANVKRLRRVASSDIIHIIPPPAIIPRAAKPKGSFMSTPSDRRYLPTHEWHKLENGLVTIGLTQFAVDELTDITFVSLPKAGEAVVAGQRFGEIESVKATSDLYSGISGTVSAANHELSKNPGLVNSDPYEKGWLIRVKPTNVSEMDKLLAVDDYLKKVRH
jgi:glycine cleavage system H protein